jgi:hypothetical protein
LWSPFSDCEG